MRFVHQPSIRCRRQEVNCWQITTPSPVSGLVDGGSSAVLDGVIGGSDSVPLVTTFDLNVKAHAAAGPTLLVTLRLLEGLTVLASFLKASKDEQ